VRRGAHSCREEDRGSTAMPARKSQLPCSFRAFVIDAGCVTSAFMMYDVCVVGRGGMGSAILAHCASRGARVIDVEQFPRGYDLGSSSGRTRMIPKA
jgi:NADPH-dependent 2,4-dienoyl-CoA reductase/sulfur reductase-like enzyme